VFSSTQLGALSTEQIASLTTAQVASLATSQIATLETQAIQALTTAHVAALTTNELAALTTTQMAAFETADIVALTTNQVSHLSTAQLAALSTEQFASIETADIVALTTSQIRSLSTDHIAAFTTAQIVAIETADIAAFTSTQHLAFTSDAIASMTAAQLDSFLLTSPIVLDLDGNGVHTLAASQGVQFDLNGTGNTHQVGWASSTDGLLVMDRNHDGRINDGTELFGVATLDTNGHRAGNGYNAMAMEDSNHDGKLTATDAHFADLRLWVDANSNGITDAGELHALAEYGITELSLNAQAGTVVDHGNVLGLTSSYTTADGAKHDMADVWFAKETAPQVHIDDLLTAPSADVMGTLAPSSTDVATSSASATTSTHDASANVVSDASHGSVSVTVSGDVGIDTAAALALARSNLLDEQRNTPLI